MLDKLRQVQDGTEHIGVDIQLIYYRLFGDAGCRNNGKRYDFRL